jgi:hypothetical protein
MRACVLTLVFSSFLLAQAPPPLLQAPLGPDTVVATVDGTNLTIADIHKLLEGSSPQAAQSFQTNPQGTIQQLFLMHYLAGEGEKAKLGETSPYKEQLEFMRASVLASLMLNRERDGFVVSGDDIQKFYDRNQSRWGQAKIKIIFIGFKPGAAAAKGKIDDDALKNAAQNAFSAAHSPNERSEDEANKLATDLVKQLRGGADFVKLVEQYSDDSSSKGSAGDFGAPITPTGAYADDFKKPILAMKAGEISDPIKQSNGFYIVRVEDKSAQSLNDVREAIVQEMRKNHLDERMRDLNARFQPAIQRPDFFLQPGKYLTPAAPTSATPKP